jgi:addiction module HigA family antidote
MAKDAFAPVTPGEMLKEKFLVEYGLTQNHLAKAIGISPNRIAEIVNNRRRITADAALRLSLYFGNSPEVLDELTNSLRLEDCKAKS